MRFKRCCGVFVAVRGKVIAYDDSTRLQFRHEYIADAVFVKQVVRRFRRRRILPRLAP